jgi:hypothetical protein
MTTELKSINPNKPDSNEINVDYEEDVSDPGVILGLQLGDIIKIKDYSNQILNNKTFFKNMVNTNIN